MSALRSLLRHVVMDIGPLRRHRDFRLLFCGQLATFLGSMLTFVAIPFQVYALTGSSLTVGLLGLAELIPVLTLGLLGGALADVIDRRRLVLLTELSLMAMSGVLVWNATLAHPSVVVIFGVSVVAAGAWSLQRPALDALLPRLVERDELTAAGALSTFQTTVGMLAGPVIGGVLRGLGRARGDLRDRRRDVRRLARAAARDARRPAAARRPAPEPRRHRRGVALRARPPRAHGHVHRRHLGDVLRHALGALPPGRARLRRRRACSGCSTARSPRAGWSPRRRAAGPSHVQRHGRAVVAGRRGVGARHDRVRLQRGALARAPEPRRRRRSGHGERHLPQAHLERDDPRRAARPPREHRDDQLLVGPAARQRRVRRRGVARRRALLDRLGRRAVRRRRRRVRRAAARRSGSTSRARLPSPRARPAACDRRRAARSRCLAAAATAQPSSPSRWRQPSHSQSSAAAAISGNAFSRSAASTPAMPKLRMPAVSISAPPPGRSM